MDAAGTQQSLHFLGRFLNHLARLVDLNHQLDESLIGAIETPCQDRRNVEEHSRVWPDLQNAALWRECHAPALP
jgi:hypothetical protein